MLPQTRCTGKLRKITDSEICYPKVFPILSVVNWQRSAATLFSCDTGTQDCRNRAGLQEGNQVRAASTAIGRSCTFSVLGEGGGVYCPFTHNAKRPGPPSEQLHNPLFTPSYVTAGFKGCQSAIFPADWLTSNQTIDAYLNFNPDIQIGIKFSLFL